MGRWEGDTLVIDSIGFIDTTWLARGGFFHSDRMHVVEKFTRQGNTLLYDVTVEDPEVLVEPWVNSDTNPAAQRESERGSSCENEATARRVKRPKQPLRRFGTNAERRHSRRSEEIEEATHD